jgi:NAD(P)-dependent dehydrogenase (short-subunit alcohol dehydrogenase family)
LLLQDIETTSLADWRRVNAVNLDGTFLGCKFAIGAMKATGGGSIINLSSVSGLVGGHNLAAYNASKGGVRLLTKSVALHCARQGYGIRCNSIHPGFVETPMLDTLLEGTADPDAARVSLTRQVPLGRLGRTEDVGHMIVYLASGESAFVTGAEMVVDGGATA